MHSVNEVKKAQTIIQKQKQACKYKQPYNLTVDFSLKHFTNLEVLRPNVHSSIGLKGPDQFLATLF